MATAGALFILAALVLPGSPAALSWPREIGLLGLFALIGWVFWSCGRGARGAIDEAERARRILAEYAPGEPADETKPLRAPPAPRTIGLGGRP
jgi:hypothetical protein